MFLYRTVSQRNVVYIYCYIIYFHLISVHGVGEQGSAGAVSSLAKQAAALSQDQPDNPTICIESDAG